MEPFPPGLLIQGVTEYTARNEQALACRVFSLATATSSQPGAPLSKYK